MKHIVKIKSSAIGSSIIGNPPADLPFLCYAQYSQELLYFKLNKEICQVASEKQLHEFTFYYRRIIKIERYLKDLIIEKYTEVHGEKAYSILYKMYFSRIRGKSANDTRFLDINNALKSDKVKLEQAINKLYISEVLSLFNNKAYLKDKVRKIFFTKPVKTNKSEFKTLSRQLKEFRNTVCHFDVRDFSLNKKIYINALLYFEKLLDCGYKYTNGAIDSISHKLSIKSILKLIYDKNPEYFDDDRILVNVFDDIALLTGFRTSTTLPPYKSIIRAKFYIESEYKNVRKR